VPAPGHDALLTEAVIYFFVIALVLRRTLTTQTMRVANLPIFAVVIVVVLGVFISRLPASSYSAIAIAIGVVLGVGLGYLRGRHSVVTAGPRPGTVFVKGSPLLAAIIVVALLARLGARFLFPEGSVVGNALIGGLLAFAALSVGVARMMLYVAARRVIAPAV